MATSKHASRCLESTERQRAFNFKLNFEPKSNKTFFYGLSVGSVLFDRKPFGRQTFDRHLKQAALVYFLHFKCHQDYLLSPWTNLSLQDMPWAEFTTLEVAAYIPCTYCPVLQYNLT